MGWDRVFSAFDITLYWSDKDFGYINNCTKREVFCKYEAPTDYFQYHLALASAWPVSSSPKNKHLLIS